VGEGDGERQFGRRATDNLERIWDEVIRVRDRQHALENELAALRYLGEQVRDLAHEVKVASEHYQQLSRRALERPTAAGYSAIIAGCSFLLAIVAFIIALAHNH